MASYVAHPDPADAESSSTPRETLLAVEELQAALARPGQPGRTSSRRGPVTLAIALVAAAAAVAAATAVVSRQQTGEPGAAVAPAPASPNLSTSAGSGRAADDVPYGSGGVPAAGEAEGDSGLLVAPPQGVVWELFEGVAVPTSQAHGPSRVDGPVHGGFSRTPTGALLAAAQIGVRRIVTPNAADLRTVNEQQLLPGAGRTAFLALIATQQDGVAATGSYAQTAGFQMLAFTQDVAVLGLATRSPRGALQASTITLRWASGDWKVQLPPSGLEQPRFLADLSGFVPWSGVS